jgi:hypothetical protein
MEAEYESLELRDPEFLQQIRDQRAMVEACYPRRSSSAKRPDGPSPSADV